MVRERRMRKEVEVVQKEEEEGRGWGGGWPLLRTLGGSTVKLGSCTLKRDIFSQSSEAKLVPYHRRRRKPERLS